MIIIVSGYTRARKSSISNHNQREWVPTSLCENPRRYYLNDSVLDLSDLIVI